MPSKYSKISTKKSIQIQYKQEKCVAIFRKTGKDVVENVDKH